MRAGRFLPLLILIMTPCLSPESVFGGQIDAHIVQFQLERLYIDVGTDRFVYPGCRFSLTCHGEKEYSGVIQHALPGIAVSEPIDTTLGPEFLNTCHVVVDAYQTDPTQPVTLGITSQFPLVLFDDTVPESPYVENSPRFKRYESNLEMLFDYQSGKIDGFMTYYYPDLTGMAGRTTGYPAPFVAALIPNLTHEVNNQAHLTTALYYLYDDTKLPLMFDGDSMIVARSFLESDTTAIRPFGVDLERGRQLLRQVIEQDQITIAVQYPSLRGVADYYADILSRSKISVGFVDDQASADCILTYVPLHPSETVTPLGWIFARLPADTVAGTSAAEGIALAAKQYEAAVASDDSASRHDYFHKAEQRLMAEVGLFPLFRPTIFLTTSRLTARLEPTKDMDLHQLVRLVPPEYLQELHR